MLRLFLTLVFSNRKARVIPNRKAWIHSDVQKETITDGFARYPESDRLPWKYPTRSYEKPPHFAFPTQQIAGITFPTAPPHSRRAIEHFCTFQRYFIFEKKMSCPMEKNY